MSVEVCSQCHNTTFHFDRARHAIVCDICGWERNNSERADEMLAYDQQRQKAIAFVKARDYASAKPFLERMRNMTPDDPDIYYLHLMGLTDCCQNLLLEPSDTQNYSLVQNHWQTFCSLNGDRRIFLQYFSRREQELNNRRQKKLLSSVTIAALCYLPLLASFSLLCSELYWSLIPIIVLFMIIAKQRPLTTLLKMLFEHR